tara:strand:+ start:213 stop:683 length:471 start_codon:yes stop_codon:yes gene_type:complete
MAKKTKKLHPGGFAQNDFMAGVRRQQRGQKNKGKVDSQQQRTPNQLKRQRRRAIKNAQKFLKQNPMMPTAGMSQGRSATGRTPMPGPAPDPERMKRFEKLMREQRERLNKLQKPRAVTPRPGPIDPKSLPTLDDAMRAAIKAGRLPASNRRKKPTS